MMNTAQKGLSSRESLLKSYNRRLKDDIRSILDNFSEIVKTAKVKKVRLLLWLPSCRSMSSLFLAAIRRSSFFGGSFISCDCFVIQLF